MRSTGTVQARNLIGPPPRPSCPSRALLHVTFGIESVWFARLEPPPFGVAQWYVKGSLSGIGLRAMDFSVIPAAASSGCWNDRKRATPGGVTRQSAIDSILSPRMSHPHAKNLHLQCVSVASGKDLRHPRDCPGGRHERLPCVAFPDQIRADCQQRCTDTHHDVLPDHH